MSTFELGPVPDAMPSESAETNQGLGSPVLLHNAVWFTKVRWTVVVVFFLTGIAGLTVPDFFTSVGLVAPNRWPIFLAVYLTAANLWFRHTVGHFTDSVEPQIVSDNLLQQIIVDLLAVTTMVHYLGSVDTFAPFVYLFHIAMACIFFPQRKSLAVSIIAAVLYGGCIALETTGILAHSTILSTVYERPSLHTLSMAGPFAASAIFIWFVVWYFVSSLSGSVRKHQQELSTANEQLKQADKETNQQVLRTTHDLKAPFTGIEANIELLRSSHWDQIPEDVQAVIERIQVRARTLSERIKAILVLGNLKGGKLSRHASADTDLSVMFESVLKETDELATERNITVTTAVPALRVIGDSGQYAILFGNIVANAIFYSHEGGTVEITAGQPDGETVSIAVVDHGIGIRSDAVARIFEEYYRTSEAARFNKMSSGLGLAIVKEVATKLKLRIIVSSEEGEGTTFEVLMPKADDTTKEEKE